MFGLEGIIGFAFTMAIIAIAVKFTLIDGTYAVRGQMPPRVKLRMAELQKNGRTRYGLWDYLRDLWHDSLEDRRKNREVRRNDPNAGRGPMRLFLGKRWESFWDDAWDSYLAKKVKKAQKAAAKESQPAQPAKPAREYKPVDPDAPFLLRWATVAGNWWTSLFNVVLRRDHGTSDGNEAGGTPGPDVVDMKTRLACSQCPRGVIQENRQWPGRPNSSSFADQRCDKCGWLSDHGGPPPADVTRPGSQTNPSPRPVGSPASPNPGGQPMATVIPMFPSKEGSTMSDAPEVTGLGTAQQYASGMSRAFASQTAQTEQFVATLQGHEVSGEAIAAAAAAQEASAVAAAAWSQANAVLVSHDQVKEAYGSNPGAGSKEFVTAE